MVDDAINAAIRLRSVEALQFIQARCPIDEANSRKIQEASENFKNAFGGIFKIFKN